MTKYRTVSNGYWKFLQYQRVAVRRRWWFFREEYLEWAYVPRPYYDPVRGRRDDPEGANTLVNSLEDDLEEFVKTYPDIKDYWPVYTARQMALERVAEKLWAEVEERKQQIRYFNFEED